MLLLFFTTSLLFKIRSYTPCAICGVKTRISVASETMVGFGFHVQYPLRFQ